MKILGRTHQGYICEASKEEMKSLTNVDESYSGHAHAAGNLVNVIPLRRHILDMAYTTTQRQKACELLRAAASIIETVPEAFTAPDAE